MWNLLAGGALMGLAVGARLTYLGYAASTGIVVLIIAFARLRDHGRGSLMEVFGFGAPLLASGLLLAAYNYARFGSPLESGWQYQLAGLQQPANVNIGDHLAQYLAAYLLSIPIVGLAYPYVHIAYNVLDPRGHFLLFPDQSVLSGISVEAPLISPFILAPIAFFGLLFPAVHRRIPTSVRALLSSVFLGVLATLLLLTGVGGIDARYFADISPPLTLAGSLLLLYCLASTSAPAWLSAAAVSAWAVAIVVGLTLGFGAWLYSFAGAARTVKTDSYAVTDAVLWRLAAARGEQGFVEDIENENGPERASDGHAFFWLGAGGATIHLVVGRATLAHLTAELLPGPSLPETDRRSVRITARPSYNEVILTQGETKVDVLIPMAPGPADIHIQPLDRATLARLPNGDTRPLVVQVRNLAVDLRQT
jgi:hypothetical protein